MIRAKSPTRRDHFLLSILIVAMVLAGCGKDSLSRSQQRAITAEIVAAAEKNAARKSEVTVRSGLPSLWALLRGQTAVDTISVTLAQPSRKTALEHVLWEIARRHRLSMVEKTSADADHFELFFQGTQTHIVRLVARLAAAPKLAIIIDDLGNDWASANSVISLSFPITVSILPDLPLSGEISEEAYRRGDQVLLHLPMQADSDAIRQERTELRLGMSARQVRLSLERMLKSVPHVVGVNNHEGSRATSDPALMQALMPVLRERGLFFVDSRTTAATVAYNTAERFGVAAASRKVFLDDTAEGDAIREQLDLAAADAVRDGNAIAIGHPHNATLAVLADAVPALESRGIRMVFASELVH